LLTCKLANAATDQKLELKWYGNEIASLHVWAVNGLVVGQADNGQPFPAFPKFYTFK